MNDTNQAIQQLSIDSIQPNPLQPRGSMDETDLQELAASIQLHGMLEPIVVAHTPAGFMIIAGERRWKAAKIAGLSVIPCVIRETSSKGMLEMAIIENVQRVDLQPLDRANAFDRLLREFRLTVGQIANRIGKSQSFVSNTLRLLSLPDALKDGLLGGMITEGHARALSAIDDQNLMVEAYKILLKEGGSVRRAEDLARRMKVRKYKSDPDVIGKLAYEVSEQVDEWQNMLEKSFGERSKVKLTRSRSQTKVVIILQGGPEQTQSRLERILRLTEDRFVTKD